MPSIDTIAYSFFTRMVTRTGNIYALINMSQSELEKLIDYAITCAIRYIRLYTD